MELELKYLQSYPLGKDGIKVMINEDGLRELWDIDEDMTNIQNPYYINSIDFDLKVLQLVSVVDERYSLDEMELKWISLVALPLSDLIDNILDDNNNANYQLSCELAELLNTTDANYFVKALIQNTYYAVDVRLWNDIENWLNKNHFDWKYNLIENGLAIDVNTLTQTAINQITK